MDTLKSTNCLSSRSRNSIRITTSSYTTLLPKGTTSSITSNTTALPTITNPPSWGDRATTTSRLSPPLEPSTSPAATSQAMPSNRTNTGTNKNTINSPLWPTSCQGRSALATFRSVRTTSSNITPTTTTTTSTMAAPTNNGLSPPSLHITATIPRRPREGRNRHRKHRRRRRRTTAIMLQGESRANPSIYFEYAADCYCKFGAVPIFSRPLKQIVASQKNDEPCFSSRG